MSYKLPRLRDDATFMIAGCGGTGGFVAEGLCRLLTGRDNHISLIDFDRVEGRNVGRQNFYPEDVGKFKAQALAERLAVKFNRKISYGILPVQKMDRSDRGIVTIGCVDDHKARKDLEIAGYQSMGNVYSYEAFKGWLIDAGNDEYSGQVMIGNELAYKSYAKTFFPSMEECRKLPLPTVQEPALLLPSARPDISCADALEREEQSPVINQAMANIVLTFVHKLMLGTLDWMRVYVDLERGTMSPVMITPEAVSRITGETVERLEGRRAKRQR